MSVSLDNASNYIRTAKSMVASAMNQSGNVMQNDGASIHLRNPNCSGTSTTGGQAACIIA